jgi:hypothetical protein
MIFQALIMFAVIGTDIHWKWSTNMYFPAIAGFIAAYLATVLAWKVRDLMGWSRQDGKL